MNQKIAVGIVFVSAMFMNIMDITIVNVALPTIGRDFKIPPTAVDGVVIAYLVSLAVFIPASGWLGDRFGGKRVLLTAIVVFTIGSALCGIAQNETELVLFRVIQGAGGGMMAPVGMAMLYRVFPPAERVRAASILTLGTTVAPAVGPVLGGFLVTNFSWRWVFFVNVPIGIVAVLFGALVLQKVEAIDAGRFDVPGFILGGAGLGLLMYGISEGPLQGWSSVEVIATCLSGVALLVAFVLVELRTTRPMVDLHLLRERLFRATNCVMFLAAAAFLGLLYLIPLYFQDARGLSALQSGLSTFPEAFGVMIGAQFASRFIYPRIGPRRHITGGLLGLALCMLVLTQITVTTNLWFIRGLMFVLGWMMAQVMVPNQAAAFAMITPDSMGRASTFFNTMRQVGSATGVAVLSTVLISVGATHGNPNTSPDITGYRFAFLAAAIFALAAAAFSFTIHDSDAAATIVRRVRRPAAVRTPADPGPRRQPGMTTVETLCVFCGSSPGVDPVFTAAAERFGTAVAGRGIELVYGGASVGLMGVVADAALAAGGRATGVITESLAGHEIAHETLSDLHVVSTMHERKALMSELSDAFVMLPGGFGTYEEFMESVTWAQLGIHDKPCGILNVDGFFDDLLGFVHHAVAQGFIKARQVDALVISDDVDDLLTALAGSTQDQITAR